MRRYEYMQRDYLSEKQISLYDEIIALVEQHKEIKAYTEVSEDEIMEVIVAILCDYPEYGVAWDYAYSVHECQNQKGRFVQSGYMYDKSKAKVMLHCIDNYIRENICPYVKNAGCKTEKDIVTAIYTYLAGVLKYTSKQEVRNGKTTFPHKAYTLETLCDLEGVCQGISLSLIYILRAYEIECLFIRGRTDDESDKDNGELTHGWCLVKLDGTYYHLDLTWDLQEQEFQYFLLTDAEMYMRHHRWDYDAYPKAG